jgi:hypothetical protein
MKKRFPVKLKDRVFWNGIRAEGGTIIEVRPDGCGGSRLVVKWDSPSSTCEDGIGHFSSSDVGVRLQYLSHIRQNERREARRLLKEVCELKEKDPSLFSKSTITHLNAALKSVEKALVWNEAKALLRDS